MASRLFIVGTGMLAEQAAFYFEGTGAQIDAFVLDTAFIREPSFRGRPVLAPEEARARFGPHSHQGFVAIGLLQMAARQRWVQQLQAAGYHLASHVHPTAHVAANVVVGENTLVQELAVVAPFAVLGDNVMLCPQAALNHHSRLGAHSFMGPAATVAGAAVIGERCFLGAGCTVRDRVTIGDDCIIGAGALVMHDCPAGGTYRATPTTRRQAPAGPAGTP